MAKTFKRLQKPEEKTISFDSPAVIKDENLFFKEDSPLGKAESFGQSLKSALLSPIGKPAADQFEQAIPDDYLSEDEIDNIAYDAKIAAAQRENVAQEDAANRVFGTSVGGLVTEGYRRELAAGVGFPAGAFASTVTALGGGSLIDLLFGELTEGREDKGRAVSERIRSYMAESQRSQVRYPSDYKGNRPFKNIMSDEAFNTWKRSSIQALAQAPLMLSAPLIGWEGVVGTHVFGQTYDSYEEYTAAGGSKQLGMLYGLANGVVEYGVTKAFQSIGLAGLEQAFKAGKAAVHPAKQAMMREVAARGLLNKFGVTVKGTPAALASFATTATPEAIEETMIAVMQNSLRAVSGLDPNAADFENQWKAAVDATITSMLMTGAMNTTALARGTWNKDTQQWTPDGDVQLRDVDQSPMQLAMNDPTGGIPVVGELNLGLDLTEDQRAELEEDYKQSKQQDVEQSERQMEREKALTEAKSVSSSLNQYTEEVTDANGDVVEVETPADAQNVRVTLNTEVDSIEYDILSYMVDENKLKLIDDDGNIKFSKLTDVSLTDEQVKKNIDNSDILSPVPEGTRSVFGRAETEPDPTVAPVLNDNTETIQDKIDAAAKENMTAEEYLDYLTQRKDLGIDVMQAEVSLPDDAQDRSVFDVAGRDSRLDAQEAQEQYELLAEFASRNNLPEQWLQENDPRRKDSVFNESNEAPVQPEADPVRDVIQLQEEAKDVKSIIERTKRNAEAAIRQEIEERYPVESYTPVSQQFLERIIRDRLEQQFLMFSQSGTDINSLSLKLQLDLGATDADVQAALAGLQGQGLAQVDSTSNRVLPSKKFVDANRKELLEGEVGEVSEGRSYSEYVVEQNPINTDFLAFDLDQTGDASRMAKTKDGPIAVNIQRNQDGSHTVTLTKPEKFKGQREVFDADTSSKDVAEAAVGMLHDAIEFHGLPDSKSPQEQAELNDPNDAGWESYFNYLGAGLARNAGKALLEAGQAAVGAARGTAASTAQDIALSRMARRGARAFNDAYRNTIEYLTGKKRRPDGTVSYRDFLEAAKKDKERGVPTILDDEVDLVTRDAVVKGMFEQPWFVTPDQAGVVDRGPLYQIGTKAEDTADAEAQEKPPEKTAEEVEAEKKRQFTIAKRFMEAIGQGMKFEDFIRAQEFGFEGTIEDIESGLLTEDQLGQLSKAIGEIVDLEIKQQREAEDAKKAEAEAQAAEPAETTQDTEVKGKSSGINNPQDGRTFFTPDALQAAEMEAEGKSRSIVIDMSPEDFLRLADQGEEDSKTATVAGVLDANQQLSSIPRLTFTNNADGTAVVVAHEGRHRARALIERGVTSMPIILVSTGSNAIRWSEQSNRENFDRVKGEWPKTLFGEGKNKDNQIPFPVADPVQEPVSEVKVEDEVEEEEEVTPPSGENHDIFMRLFTNNEAGGFLSSTEPVYVEYEGYDETYTVVNYRPSDGQMTLEDESGDQSTWNIMDGEFSIVKTEPSSDEPSPEDMQGDEQVDIEMPQETYSVDHFSVPLETLGNFFSIPLGDDVNSSNEVRDRLNSKYGTPFSNQKKRIFYPATEELYGFGPNGESRIVGYFHMEDKAGLSGRKFTGRFVAQDDNGDLRLVGSAALRRIIRDKDITSPSTLPTGTFVDSDTAVVRKEAYDRYKSEQLETPQALPKVKTKRRRRPEGTAPQPRSKERTEAIRQKAKEAAARAAASTNLEAAENITETPVGTTQPKKVDNALGNVLKSLQDSGFDIEGKDFNADLPDELYSFDDESAEYVPLSRSEIYEERERLEGELFEAEEAVSEHIEGGIESLFGKTKNKKIDSQRQKEFGVALWAEKISLGPDSNQNPYLLDKKGKKVYDEETGFAKREYPDDITIAQVADEFSWTPEMRAKWSSWMDQLSAKIEDEKEAKTALKDFNTKQLGRDDNAARLVYQSFQTKDLFYDDSKGSIDSQVNKMFRSAVGAEVYDAEWNWRELDFFDSSMPLPEDFRDNVDALDTLMIPEDFENSKNVIKVADSSGREYDITSLYVPKGRFEDRVAVVHGYGELGTKVQRIIRLEDLRSASKNLAVRDRIRAQKREVDRLQKIGNKEDGGADLYMTPELEAVVNEYVGYEAFEDLDTLLSWTFSVPIDNRSLVSFYGMGFRGKPADIESFIEESRRNLVDESGEAVTGERLEQYDNELAPALREMLSHRFIVTLEDGASAEIVGYRSKTGEVLWKGTLPNGVTMSYKSDVSKIKPPRKQRPLRKPLTSRKDIEGIDTDGRDFADEPAPSRSTQPVPVTQEVRDSLIDYMIDRDEKGVPLQGILSELSSFLKPEQIKSLSKPLRAAWDVINSESEAPITPQQIDAAFQPYEGTANVQPNADGLESGQGGTGVGSQGRTGDSSAAGSTGDTVGGVPESAGDQARTGSGERGLRRRTVQTDVATADSTADSTRRRRLGDRSPDDATVSGLPDGDAGLEGGRLSDEDRAERRSERRAKFDAELRSVSRQDFSGDVASVPYQNVSGQTVDKILVPTNHADAVASNMRKIQDRYYYLPNFVAKETGLDQTSLENFSAMYDYQLEGVAAAIAAHKRGESYILGWQTGIGKGRVVASVMQYARKQGLLPVFVTDRPDLFSSMMEDTYNIGAIKEDGDFVPFITNNANSESAAIDLNANIEGFGERKQVQNKSQSEAAMDRMAVRKGKLVDGDKKYDAIFTTYDQMRPSKGLTYRNNFINNIAERAFFILDESHKIGEGKGRNADGTERLSTGSFLRDAIAASRGALFSSATFSKTSDQIKTYVTAGLEKSLDDPTQLGDLLSSMGDAGLQIFSQGLADNGTYSRLERDMADVEVTTKQVTTVPEQVDAISQSLASLQDAQVAIKLALKSSIEKVEGGLFESDASSFIVGLPDGYNKGKLKDYTKPSETSGIPFVPTKVSFKGSPQHQDVITTAITAMKVEAAADDIITQVKAGKKVVAVFDSTMESALNKFVSDQGIGIGNEVNFNLKSVLLQQVEEARKVEVLFERKTVDENGDRIRNKKTGEPLKEKKRVSIRLEDSELSKEALAAIDKARSLINSLPDDIAGSPIDGVAKRLTEEGIQFAELTGRKRVIDYSSGKPIYAARDEREVGGAGKKAVQDRFNNDSQLKVILANRSIATGMNLQASFGFADQSQRHMTLIEIAKDINALMQLLGRINRANQRTVPTYSFMLTDSPTEIRIASMFSKKLRSLSASVSADGESSINPDMPDYMNFVGEYVLNDVLLQMKHEGIDLLEQMGKKRGLVLNGEEAVLKQREGDLNFFNEITSKLNFLPIAAQKEVWSRMERAYQSELESLAMAGDSPLKAKLYDFKAKTLDFEVVKAPRNAAAKEGVFGSGVRLQRVSAKNDGGILTEFAIEKRIADTLKGNEPAQFTAELMDTVINEHESYMEDRTARIAEIGIDAEARIKELNTSASSRMNVIQSVLDNPVGAHVVLTTKTRNPSNGQLEDYNVPAVILEHVRRGQSEDPANLSDFYVRVAVPDERGVAQISYEQISQGRFAISDPSLTRKDTLKVFNDKTKGGRIERYIATGDVVAALEQFKGYGVPGFYTNDRGEQRAGVILHRDFDPEIWRENRPASISNPNSAAMALVEGIPLRFLDGKAQITGRSDGLHIQMPFEAKGNGVSKIKKSLEDAGLKFGKSEDGLTAFINKPYSKDRLWESVVKRIIDNAGGSVVAARNHSLAREIIRDVEGLDDPRVMDGRDLFRSSRSRKKDKPLAAEELNPHTDARREINFWNEVTTGGQIHVNNKDAENIIVQSKSLVNSLATIFDLKNWEGGVAGRDVHAWYQGAKKHQKYGTGEIVTAKHASARIGVRLHEIAHALDDRYSITKDQLTDEQLEKIKYLDPSIARVEEGKGRVREGWAEFVRRMFTQSSVNPEDARVEFAERIGNFDLQEFMDEMTNWMADFANKKENSALKKQLKKARKLMNAYRDQPLANKLDSMVNVQPVDDLALSPMERASRWAAGLGRKVMFHFNDDLNEVMRFDRASVNSVNANRMALEDLVASKRHQANEQGRLAQILGVFDPNTNEMISSSGVISDFHGGIQSFFDMKAQIAVGQNKRQQIQYKNRAKVFAWARHTAWLADQEWAQDYESGMGVEEAIAFMNEIKKDPEMYNDYIKMAEEISDQGLKYLKVALRTGGLDPNMYRFLYERYHRSKNYFPMYRIRNQENSLAMDLSASGINFTKNPLKGRSRYGNGDPVEDPLVSLESMAVDVYHKSAQTTITKEIYKRLDSGLDAGLGQFARVRDKSTKITQQRMEDIVKQLVERGIVSDRDASLFRAAHRMRQGLEKIGYKLGDQVAAPVVSTRDMNNLAAGLGFNKNDPDLPTKLARAGFVPSSKLPSLEGFVSTFTQVYDKPRNGEELRVAWVPVGVDPDTKEPILKEVQIELIPEFAESLGSLKPIERNVFYMFLGLGYQSIRTAATGTFSFFVKDLPRNVSSALARTDIEESPYLPFYNTLKGTIKEFHNRYGVELVRKIASKVPVLNETGWIKPPTELQDMDSLYVLMEKQGGSAFTKLGSFVKGSRSRKRVERSLMSVPLDSRSTALDMIFNGGARAGLLQALKSPDGDAINLKGVTLERVLSGMEKLKDVTTDKMANYFDAMQRFANASDKPTRLTNARNKLNELGYTALTGNSFLDPDGVKRSGLPQDVLVAVIAAYQSGGLNHIRGGRFTRHTSRYVNFLNTNWHSVITDAVLLKRGAFDVLAEKLLPEKVSRRIIGKRKQGLSDAKARHMTILAAKYLPLMAYSAALAAMYRLFNDEEEHYENAPEKRKDGAWLLGSQGRTLLEIRKSSQFRPAQDLGIYLAESFLESERSKGRGSVGEIMWENTKAPANQLLASFNGGPLGILLQVASNETYFETPITPSFMQSNFSPTQQFLPNTTWLARKGSEIGYGITGWEFVTPLNIDHMMEGMTARLWGWGHDVVGGTFDQTMKMYDVATGEKRIADYVSQFPAEEMLQGMPMLGTAFPYRTEVEPIYSLQAALDEQQTVVNDHHQMGMSGSESARIARREAAFLDKFNDLVKGLNQLQHQMEDGKEDVKRLAVGTARQALGLRTQDNFKSVLTRDRDSLPKAVVDVVDQFLDLTIDRTLRVSARGKIESSDVPLIQQKLEYLEHVDNVAAFVREISDMPYVAGYLRSKYSGSRMTSLRRSLSSRPEKDGDLNPHEQRKYNDAYDETTFRVRRLLKDLKAIR